MPYIGNNLATQFQAFATQTITGDGSTSYTLDRAVANGKELLVYINNVKQEEGSGKSYEASGTTITFSEAVASGDSCYLVYMGSAQQTVTAPAGSIVSGQIANASLELPNSLDMNGKELILDSDGDTSITSDTDDQIDFKTGGSDRVIIDSSGKVLLGTSQQRGHMTLQIEGDGSSSAAQGSIFLRRGLSTSSIGGNTGADLGLIQFGDNDGGIYASIQAKSDSPAANNDYPGRLEFSLTGDGESSPTERARILNNGALQVKQAGSHYSDWSGNDTGSQVNGQATDKVVFTVDATVSSYASDVQRILCDRSATSSYDFLVLTSGNLGDDEFRFSGEGNGSCDGSFGGGGADYAEYFEWKDGNASNEDRVGISVKLDGNMIVASSDSDNASDIIGVISANPAVTGDGAWNKWNQKYLRDDFGRYIKEEYTVTEWQENVEGKIDNNINSVSYETDKIPSDVTVPKNAKVLTVDDNGAKFTRRKLNPNYDESKTYVPREDRPEWDTVGLMGKLRIKKGQKTGTNWIKMRDVSDTVEEWLVR